VAVNSSNDVSRGCYIPEVVNCYNSHFAPETKVGSDAFSVGICLAKCLTHLSKPYIMSPVVT